MGGVPHLFLRDYRVGSLCVTWVYEPDARRSLVPFILVNNASESSILGPFEALGRTGVRSRDLKRILCAEREFASQSFLNHKTDDVGVRRRLDDDLHLHRDSAVSLCAAA